MTRPWPNQEETDPDAATSPRQPEELPDASVGTNQPAAAQPANAAVHARPSLAEADPLLSLLRGGIPSTAPVVSGKPTAKAEKARLEQDKLEKAKLAHAESEPTKSEMGPRKEVRFEEERSEEENSEDAKSVAPQPEDSAHSEPNGMWTVGVVLLALACVAGVFDLIRSGFFR